MAAADLSRALDPKRSCVVVACAGSGKTWLLTSRILRALLDGARPDEILAITFTRKAIGEIRERVGSLIDEFAEADDDALARRLKEIGAGTDPAARARARGLRRDFLLSDKGMSIYTFHGWFLRLLRSAPWLPNPSIPRQVADAGRLLLEEAWGRLLEPSSADRSEGKALLELVDLTDEQINTVKGGLKALVDRRELWLRFKAECRDGGDPVDAAVGELGRFLQAGPEDDPVGDLLESGELWEGIDRIRAHAGALGDRAPDRAKQFLDDRLEPQRRSSRDPCLEALKEALLTKAGMPRKGLEKGALEKVADEVAKAQELLMHMIDHRRRVEALRFNRLALTVADAWLRRYDDIKDARGEHDFADFEVEACRLLSDDDGKGNADAIRYKMGQNYRHILVDEFQDTNALQWEALRAWLDSVLDTDVEPKVFIVGDPKQSVYRFRGGDPALLGEAEAYLTEKYGAHTVRQNVTRRCAPRLLDIVNSVFDGTLADFETHEAFEGNARLPGRVELLAMPDDGEGAAKAERAKPGDEPLPLRNPLTAPPPKGADSALDKALPKARMLAERLRAAKEEWSAASSDGTARPCEWKDFMVLFAQRTHLPALERALRSADIPCVSDSGSGLTSLECTDILALMQTLASPRSNLLLLQVLRSPLFGVASEDLSALAAGSDREQSAWRSLQKAKGVSPRMDRARDLLGEWRRLYREQPMPAHDFMSEIYRRAEVFERYDAAVPKGIRHRVRANLLMLLHMSLREGMARHPHLPRLLREYRRMAAADADGGGREDPPLGDEVALLTVHKAKGLERPFVFVYDANRGFGHSQGSTPTWTLMGVPRGAGAPLPAFRFSSAQGMPEAFAELAEREKERELAEWRNKLYIALTRAQQGVVVCSGGGNPKEGSWYEMVGKAMSAVAGDKATFHGDSLAAECTEAAGEASAPEPEPEPPLKPPEVDGADIIAQQWVPHRLQTPAQERGERLHAILALRIAGIEDPAAARRAAPMQRSLFDELWEVSGRMLAAPDVRRLLGPENPGARACEVEIAGPDGNRRLDCIVEFEGALWILDFKTGDVEDSLEKYRRQLDGYGALLRAACPDRKVRCALVSERGDLIEVEGT